MKIPAIVFLVVCAACSNKQEGYRKAEDALDAGREYINACQLGDFSRAAFYALPDERTKALISETEKKYRQKDKEGRQQLRTASINISEVKELTDSSTEIDYNISSDKQPMILQVIKRNNEWLAAPAKNP